MSAGSPMERKGRLPCPPRLLSDQREAEKRGLEGVPLADHCWKCLGDPLLEVVLDLGRDPDQEQVGRLGLLGERLPGKVVEGHHRLGKALSQRGFGLAG